MERKKYIKKKVSINDVAKAVGLSRGTVSRAFNDHRNDISEKSKEYILSVARKMGYYPDRSARSLVKGKTESIGLVVPDLKNPFLCQMVTEIEKYSKEKGYSVLLSLIGDEIDEQEKVLNRMKSGLVDAVIITPCEHNRSAAMLNKVLRSRPIVSLKKLLGLRCDIVSFDDGLGVELMIEHLFSNGHKRIVYFSPSSPAWTVEVRSTAYKLAMEQKNLTPKLIKVKNSEFCYEKYLHLIEELLNERNPPTAIFAYDDIIAVNLIRTLKQMGLKIPEEISVVGFDNISIGEIIEPPLSTVAIDGAALGKNALDIIFTKLDNKDGYDSLHDIKLIPKLIERNSVCKCKDL